MKKQASFWSVPRVLALVLICAAGWIIYHFNTVPRAAQPDEYKNINLTILMDLSDRISEDKNPGQSERDIKSILYCVEAFQEFAASKGKMLIEDKIKTLFYPADDDKELEKLSAALNVDLRGIDSKERPETVDGLKERYESCLSYIYSTAKKKNSYPGSDIWSYCKERLGTDLEGDSNYVNILVVISDGYMYFDKNMKSQGSQYTYLTPTADYLQTLRRAADPVQMIEDRGIGFINTGNKFNKFNVLGLEFKADKNHIEDFGIMKKMWSDWFKKQGADNIRIIPSDLPDRNREAMKVFIRNTALGKI